jgi:hypothetical protein
LLKNAPHVLGFWADDGLVTHFIEYLIRLALTRLLQAETAEFFRIDFEIITIKVI